MSIERRTARGHSDIFLHQKAEGGKVRFLEASFVAGTDGIVGLQQLAGAATSTFCMTEKRMPDVSRFPRLP